MKVLLCSLFVFFAFTCAEYSHQTRDKHPCERDRDCEQRYAINSRCEKKTCECFTDYWEKISCKKTALLSNYNYKYNAEGEAYGDHVPFIGDSCETHIDCNYINTQCNMDTDQCDCRPGYTSTKDGKYCLKVADNLGSSCKRDEQCTYNFEHAKCTDSRCACGENYHELNDKCEKNIGFGEECNDSRECWHIIGRCDEKNHTCVCLEELVINSQKTMCLDIVTFGKRCLETVQCTASLKDTECINGYCHCARGFHFSLSDRKCLFSKALGQPCIINEECYEVPKDDDDKTSLQCAFVDILTSTLKECKKVNT